MEDTPKGDSGLTDPSDSANPHPAPPEAPAGKRGAEPGSSAGPTLTRRILELAVPSLGALIAQPLFTLIDSAMVGHLGTAPLAGLSLAATILQTVVGLFVFLAYSTTALAAQAVGAGRRDRAIRSGIEAMWLAGALGLACAILLMTTAPRLVDLMGGSGEVTPHALAYLRWAAPGLVGMFVTYAGTGTLRGILDARTPLYVAGGGAAANVVLNAIFIYGLGMGIAGSGLGTAIAETGMALVLVLVIVRKARRLDVFLGPSAGGIWAAAVEGAPLFVRTVSLRLALLFTVRTAATAGVAALAAHQVVNAVWSFTAFALDALAIAAQALVGVALGSGRTDELRELLRKLAWWGVWAGVALGALIAALSPVLPHLFGSDPVMWRVATRALLVAAVGMPLGGIVFLLDGALIGASRSRFLALAGLVTLAGYLPALWALSLWFGTLDAHDPADQTLMLGALWTCYTVVFMGLRALANSFGTWWSRRSVVRSA